MNDDVTEHRRAIRGERLDDDRIGAEVIRDEVCSILTREIDAGGPDFSEVFDLGGVEDGNSVLIALMMSWVREAARQDRRISYRGVPRPLYELIEFYGLDEAKLRPIADRIGPEKDIFQQPYTPPTQEKAS